MQHGAEKTRVLQNENISSPMPIGLTSHTYGLYTMTDDAGKTDGEIEQLATVS